jgi:hypothetical protein
LLMFYRMPKFFVVAAQMRDAHLTDGRATN